ncbi:MAG: DUF3703 domain-containing protein [Chloracidobacterium sp.]|nr:DUF3703 domain-containing protein [Chloracidobacterium sp.]
MTSLREHIDREITLAADCEAAGDLAAALGHLERAHVLGQAITYEHTRVHWRMLKLALKMHSPREIWGQVIRIIGASTKTPLGIYPAGNTGASNVWFFKPMPIPDDLRHILDANAK